MKEKHVKKALKLMQEIVKTTGTLKKADKDKPKLKELEKVMSKLGYEVTF